METTDFQEYFEKRYQDQVNWYDKKALQNQLIYKRFQWIIIIMSAITPILVASKVAHWPTVAISAFVAIGTSALKTFQYQEHAINYRATCEILKREHYFLKAKLGDYKDRDDIEQLFIERIEGI